MIASTVLRRRTRCNGQAAWLQVGIKTADSVGRATPNVRFGSKAAIPPLAAGMGGKQTFLVASPNKKTGHPTGKLMLFTSSLYWGWLRNGSRNGLIFKFINKESRNCHARSKAANERLLSPTCA